MSLLSKEFPMEDPAGQLIFAHPWQDRIDPVFAGRLAALGKYMGRKVNLFSGFRSYEEQQESFMTSLPGYACKPGTSWHEYGMAVDAADIWLKNLEKDAATENQKTLRKFGLFKPLTKGNGQTVLEDWHIQPIETLGIGSVDIKKKYFYGYVGGLPMDVKTLQMVFGLTPDGVVGQKTMEKMKEVKSLVDTFVEPEKVTIKVGNKAEKGFILNNISYCPVRFVAETLGAKLTWDGRTDTVTISK